MRNREVREKLFLLYGAKCMLTDRESALNFHHIIKKCEGGDETIENGAILNRSVHDFVHDFESSDKDMFYEINLALKCYKVCLEWNNKECLTEFEKVKDEVKKRVKRS